MSYQVKIDKVLVAFTKASDKLNKLSAAAFQASADAEVKVGQYKAESLNATAAGNRAKSIALKIDALISG